jgi:hypothetical protein
MLLIPKRVADYFNKNLLKLCKRGCIDRIRMLATNMNFKALRSDEVRTPRISREVQIRSDQFSPEEMKSGQIS